MDGNGHEGAHASLAHEGGFRFRMRLGGDGRSTTIFTDEAPPVGDGAGPNPIALLSGAVGQCLASSLLFCMRKARLEVDALEADVHATTVRNPTGRLRIGRIDVRLSPSVTSDVESRMGRCLELFESFCTVTESVRAGIDVRVAVAPSVSPLGPRAGSSRAPGAHAGEAARPLPGSG